MSATNRRKVDLSGADFYPTPKWATHALIDNEKFVGKIWEPACGDGSMSEVLKTSNKVYSSDLFARGYGKGNIDFLNTNKLVSNIVTNPPYHSADKFLEHGLDCVERKLAFLLRLSFLEGAKRCNTIFLKYPPIRVWVFSERITFYPKDAEIKGSGTTAYAWFIWDKSQKVKSPKLSWLKPGYKAKYR